MDISTLITSLSKLSEYQIEKIAEMVEVFQGLNKELSDMIPQVCPNCGKVHDKFIKAGYANKKQRFICKECGKKFVYDSNKLTSHSHQSLESWNIVIRDTLERVSLDKMADHIGVCHTTAFYMRHKVLMCMENIVNKNNELSGLIEADETYLKESLKGIKVTHRKPRKHGERASKRGLSSELICICVASDRDKNVIAKSVNRAKPSAQNIKDALENRIASNSVIQCDGSDSYNDLIESKNCKKVELKGHSSYDKVYHLNTVNGMHSRIKEMNQNYKGISTKYLNRYMALFIMLEQNRGTSIDEMTDIIRRELEQTINNATNEDVVEKNLLWI